MGIYIGHTFSRQPQALVPYLVQKGVVVDKLSHGHTVFEQQPKQTGKQKHKQSVNKDGTTDVINNRNQISYKYLKDTGHSVVLRIIPEQFAIKL